MRKCLSILVLFTCVVVMVTYKVCLEWFGGNAITNSALQYRPKTKRVDIFEDRMQSSIAVETTTKSSDLSTGEAQLRNSGNSTPSIGYYTKLKENTKRLVGPGIANNGSMKAFEGNIQLEKLANPNSLDKSESENTSISETLTHSRKKAKIIRFHNISCDPIYPEVLLYNRIFKTGSTTIAEYIQDVTNNTNITVKAGTTEDWYKDGDLWPYPEHIEKYSRKPERLVYSAHFFFRWKMKINRTYTYINILREPVSRVVSHYHYMRNDKIRAPHRVKELKKSGLWNETLLDCIQNQHRGCEDNVMTRFICGAHDYCKTGSIKSLSKAKRNLKRYYASVGVLEEIDKFVKVLGRRLPSFFSRPYFNIHNAKKNTRRKAGEDEKILDIIRNRNKFDIELYKYAKEFQNRQFKACYPT